MIHPRTTIGAVKLKVKNLDHSVRFYQENIGFQLNRQQDDTVYLGIETNDLLILQEKRSGLHVEGTTGLYHFAILVPSRFALARSLRQLGATETAVEGFADHSVSEAVYLSDPDGNGIEIYRDRPQEAWPRQNGQILIDTKPLDLEGVMAELQQHPPQPWSGLARGTTIGHIHLHVSDLGQAQQFYTNVLGFDLIMRYGRSAAFVSAGGYHHHIGLNTWAGAGAPAPPQEALGLDWFEMRLPDEAALEAVKKRLAEREATLIKTEQGWLGHDPAHNNFLLRVN